MFTDKFESSSPLSQTLAKSDDQEGVASGPRVKHVSRSACVAQGEPAIIYPSSNLRLSALPPDEKNRIWSEKQLSDEEYSDDDKAIERSKSAKVKYRW